MEKPLYEAAQEGEAVLVGVGNSFIQSEGRVIAAIGLDNIMIVDTTGALLVANRDHAQDVKKWCRNSS